MANSTRAARSGDLIRSKVVLHQQHGCGEAWISVLASPRSGPDAPPNTLSVTLLTLGPCEDQSRCSHFRESAPLTFHVPINLYD